jgi:hypothetical protein
MCNQKDKKDEKILEIARANEQGIRLFNMSKALGWNISSTRNRILLLALDGELRVERGRNSVTVYPVEKIGGDT